MGTTLTPLAMFTLHAAPSQRVFSRTMPCGPQGVMQGGAPTKDAALAGLVPMA